MRSIDRAFTKLASRTAHAAGTSWAFIACVAVVLLWAVSGPFFHFSETWQLVINTGTTIVTFLMVFLIQNTQNRDGLALQTKLDELILTSNAENSFVGIERLTDAELQTLHQQCTEAAARHTEVADKAAEELAARKTTTRRPAKRRKRA
jgi:low affinity Fe/Cu permease